MRTLRSGSMLALLFALTVGACSSSSDDDVSDAAGSSDASGGDASLDADGANSSGCDTPEPSGCCCAIDVLLPFVCNNSKWQCSAGYHVPESQCYVCPGPCCSFDPDASTKPDSPTDTQLPDAALDSSLDDGFEGDSSTDDAAVE